MTDVVELAAIRERHTETIKRFPDGMRRPQVVTDRGTLLDEVDRLAAAITRVRDLHVVRGRNILGQEVCAECSPLKPWPCDTLRAFDGEEVPCG